MQREKGREGGWERESMWKWIQYLHQTQILLHQHLCHFEVLPHCPNQSHSLAPDVQLTGVLLAELVYVNLPLWRLGSPQWTSSTALLMQWDLFLMSPEQEGHHSRIQTHIQDILKSRLQKATPLHIITCKFACK